MKIIIAGGRDFTDYAYLTEKVKHLLSEQTNIEIVSGCAQGADSLGAQYAKENNIPLKLFPAQWDLYGKSAGYKRNLQMAEYADALIAFWDGKSKGTKNMLYLAQFLELNVRIIKY
jgi:hypothetical protein